MRLPLISIWKAKPPSWPSLAQKKTVILISHRLANVTKSDQIYFLEKGRLIEKGKHEE